MIVIEDDGYQTEIESPDSIEVTDETEHGTLEVTKNCGNNPDPYWVFYLNNVDTIKL
jgi:hypothetical protein